MLRINGVDYSVYILDYAHARTLYLYINNKYLFGEPVLSNPNDNIDNVIRRLIVRMIDRYNSNGVDKIDLYDMTEDVIDYINRGGILSEVTNLEV